MNGSPPDFARPRPPLPAAPGRIWAGALALLAAALAALAGVPPYALAFLAAGGVGLLLGGFGIGAAPARRLVPPGGGGGEPAPAQPESH